MNLTKKAIKEMTNEELVSSLLWNTVRSTNELNTRGSVTQQTRKEERYLMEEVSNRFNLDLDVLIAKMNP
ncbi:hypothetical protein [Bacillus cereus group sp. BfR-BA-01313]|uniref:hypothetical protein n=1 Tax=Bacillus cereus group sp. BfR-BA-01313 TaxID=2920290 RepID=UPI001F5A510B